MNHRTHIAFVATGLMIVMVTGGWLILRFNGADRTVFLPGETTHGHYQIEMACTACHDVGMGLNEQSCIDCHGTELKAANDSHPLSKFTDPRNADRVAILDARRCVTCHREHQPAITRAMGVTMPVDYCFHCHQQTLIDRPSHKDFAFDSCATAGCHNYHDNSALYESFLVKHGDDPDYRKPAVRPVLNLLAFLAVDQPKTGAGPLVEAEADSSSSKDPLVMKEWSTTAHAKAGVNCTDCHAVSGDENGAQQWSDKPGQESCALCHSEETAGFLASHHGMRFAQGLGPMTPALARLPMKPEAADRELNCTACHGAHEFETRTASMESCLSCHDDEHSVSFVGSPHFQLWQEEQNGVGVAGSGVSCATCHLPRQSEQRGGIARVLVQHNQNLNLRPNEKMIRSVCLDCHGLGFSIDALADRELIKNNFNGQPTVHVESIDLALRRQLEKKKPTSNQN